MQPQKTCGRFPPNRTLRLSLDLPTHSLPRGQDDGPDVFLHYSAIDSTEYSSVDEGDRVEFEVSQGQKGPQADGVRKI